MENQNPDKESEDLQPQKRTKLLGHDQVNQDLFENGKEDHEMSDQKSDFSDVQPLKDLNLQQN